MLSPLTVVKEIMLLGKQYSKNLAIDQFSRTSSGQSCQSIERKAVDSDLSVVGPLIIQLIVEKCWFIPITFSFDMLFELSVASLNSVLGFHAN